MSASQFTHGACAVGKAFYRDVKSIEHRNEQVGEWDFLLAFKGVQVSMEEAESISTSQLQGVIPRAMRRMRMR